MSSAFAALALVFAPFPQGAVDFARDVKPVLEAHCVECHGAQKSKADLRLDLRERAFAGAEGGTEPVIVPGKAAESSLYTRLVTDDKSERMPHKAPPLEPAQIEAIRRWIDGGALWPDEVAGVDERRNHWAYQRPVRPAVPKVEHRERVRNAIDAFLEARFERDGVTPAPEASRATLVRRLHLDLTGIPPTPEEVAAFENDKRADAYEQLVRKLLASPRYGERMARPWLDLARYADTQGYEKDARRSMAPYRDWVIAALNENLPFDQFSIEQLAGDLLPNATRSQRIATAFHRNTMLNEEGGTDAEEFRSAALIDRVNTTATIWMGSTLACAQCHDHKYDPFSQRDYYKLFAAFNQTADGGKTPEPMLRAPTAEQERELEAIAKRVEELERKLTAADEALDQEQRAWELQPRLKPFDELDWKPWVPTEVTFDPPGLEASIAADGTVTLNGAIPDRVTLEVWRDMEDYDDFMLGKPLIRLEVLPFQAGEHLGPGLASHGNFVLSKAQVRFWDGNPTGYFDLIRQVADVDYEQPGGAFRASQTLDYDDSTGWAIGGAVERPHRIIFEATPEIFCEAWLRLRFQSTYPRHILGRFRVSTCSDAIEPGRGVSCSPWRTVGPLVAESFEEARDTAFEPERELAEGKAFAESYRNGALAWRELELKVGQQKIPLQGERCATYLRRTITTPRARQLELYVGGDDAVKLWLNGELVHESNDYATYTNTPTRVQVRLREGVNQLLAKVTNGNGGYGFAFDIGYLTDDRITPEIEALLKLKPEERNAEQAGQLRDWYRRGPSVLGSAIADELTKLRKRRDEIEAMLPTMMVMEAVKEPRQSHVFVRGSFLTPGEPVEAGLPTLFGELGKTEPERLALARWLVSPANPLAARVHVNRTWELLFGRGIVATGQDFGLRGDAPSHPELLDWLAVEFVERGWDMKALVETIVTSAAYRRSSDVPRAEYERDRHNIELARGARLRLEAELLRDNALAISGLLVESLGGQSVFPPQPAGTWNSAYSGDDWRESAGRDRHRRGLYTFAKRTAPYVTFQLFDAPSREVACTRRDRTNTPLQALALLDDPAFVECALALARRILRERTGSETERLEWAFRACTARAPAAKESQTLLKLLRDARVEFSDVAKANERVALLEQGAVDAPELAAWASVATVLLNLDDTVVRN
ncbi:MAG: PSD1 and planctomycete cytochrome C domain-containing protein [Planctomycetota bacterium]|nr:PSD1 and planctomycete cytochrome C domain-containing protein [Planctomycetota bacterium]